MKAAIVYGIENVRTEDAWSIQVLLWLTDYVRRFEKAFSHHSSDAARPTVARGV